MVMKNGDESHGIESVKKSTNKNKSSNPSSASLFHYNSPGHPTRWAPLADREINEVTWGPVYMAENIHGFHCFFSHPTYRTYALPETNIAPENGWLED